MRAGGALSGTSSVPFWLDSPDAPAAQDPLTGVIATDLLVVGGGFQGLWTALKAKERDPGRDVVLLEAGVVGGAASGRNGGFVSSSLTHGIGNAHDRWPEETEAVERLGRANLEGLEEDVTRYGIECEYERTGKLTVATDRHQLEELEATQRLMRAYGHDVRMLESDDVAERIVSPGFIGGSFAPDANALVNPAKLVWGLLAACRRLGVRVYEGSPVTNLGRARGRPGGSLRATTPAGAVNARAAILATNAYRPLLHRLRWSTVPVYDYALVTEPLDESRRAALGWSGREGITDAGNQFHYFRLTADDRVLWGGYDAIYHYGSALTADLDQRPRTFATLAEQLVEAFPALRGIRFTHAWGGAIDTCTRFFAFYGTAMGGRLAYGLGHTGLGVAATRFAAETCLDLIEGRDTERTRLSLVNRRPVPFPPEPFRWVSIQLTRWSIAQADRRGGHRNAWLRLLDRFGIGFDS